MRSLCLGEIADNLSLALVYVYGVESFNVDEGLPASSKDSIVNKKKNEKNKILPP